MRKGEDGYGTSHSSLYHEVTVPPPCVPPSKAMTPTREAVFTIANPGTEEAFLPSNIRILAGSKPLRNTSSYNAQTLSEGASSAQRYNNNVGLPSRSNIV